MTTTFAIRNLGVVLDAAEGPRPVLAGIDLDLREGELLAVMGRSGTGKTTLLRVLGGLLEPTASSTVTFHGRPVEGPPAGVAFVFQDYAATLLPWRTVARNVGLGLEGRTSKPERQERVARALALVGLAERARDYPRQLSGGMQQRVQLARALAMRPSVVLMDEPFGALDALTRATLQDELQLVQERTGTTIVFVTHDIDEAIYLSDRVVVLDGAPATVAHEIDVDLPRPRHQLTTKEQPAYLEVRRAVYDAIVGSGA